MNDKKLLHELTISLMRFLQDSPDYNNLELGDIELCRTSKEDRNEGAPLYQVYFDLIQEEKNDD